MRCDRICVIQLSRWSLGHSVRSHRETKRALRVFKSRRALWTEKPPESILSCSREVLLLVKLWSAASQRVSEVRYSIWNCDILTAHLHNICTSISHSITQSEAGMVFRRTLRCDCRSRCCVIFPSLRGRDRTYESLFVSSLPARPGKIKQQHKIRNESGEKITEGRMKTERNLPTSFHMDCWREEEEECGGLEQNNSLKPPQKKKSIAVSQYHLWHCRGHHAPGLHLNFAKL